MRALPLAGLIAVAVSGCATTANKQAGAGSTAAEKAAEGCGPASPLVPGGIADSGAGQLFLRTEEGFEAVDLASGMTQWRSHTARLPLAVSAQYVAAASPVEDAPHALELSLHHRDRGALISVGPVIDLGRDLASGVQLQAAFCGDGTLELHWFGPGGVASGARVDLLARTVSGPPSASATSRDLHTVVQARAGDLTLKAQEGRLRAFADDGALRWERPLGPERLTAR